MRSDYSISVYRDIHAIEQEWRAFQAHATLTPYQHWEVIHAWLNTVGLHHRRKLQIITIHYQSELVTILPMMITRQCGLRVLSWIGDAHLNYHGGLYLHSHIAPLGYREIHALWAEIEKRLLRHDVCVLRQQPVEFAGLISPFHYFDPLPAADQSHQIHLPDHDYDGFLKATRSKATRKRYRNAENRLNKLGECRFAWHTDPESGAHWIDRLFAQRNARFESLGIPLEKNRQAYQDFYKQLLKQNTGNPRRQALVSVLTLDGDPLAIGFSYQGQDQVQAMLSSITADDRQKHSPGEILLRKELQSYCDDAEVNVIDYGVGSDTYKLAWCNAQTPLFETYRPRSLLGHCLVPVLRTCIWSKRQIKSSRRLWRGLRKLRSFLPPRKKACLIWPGLYQVDAFTVPLCQSISVV